MSVVANIITLPLDVIRLDGGTQPRAELNQDTLQDYAQAMMEGVVFPPVTVFYDGSDYWLGDGFHRVNASRQICKDNINAEVRQGTRRDAWKYSLGANADHGLRRTNADKRRVVESALRDEELSQWSNREIARICNVDEITVRRHRDSFTATMSQLGHDYPKERTYITKHGTIAAMNTSNIGKQESLTPQQFLDEVAPGFTRWERERETPVLPPTWNHVNGKPFNAPLPDGKPIAIPEEWKLPPEMRSEPTVVSYPNGQPTISIVPESKSVETPVIDRPSIREEPPIKSTTLTVLQSSESVEWYTPSAYVDAARELLGTIDLDPASNELANQVVQATIYHDIHTNGLDKSWHGRIWLNPPYGITDGKSNQEVWSSHLIEQYQAGITAEAVLLVNANTEAKWFQPLYDYPICFTNHRIRFYNTEGNSSQPTQGNALVYFGHQEQRFIELFKCFGVIVRRIDNG